MRCGLPYNAVFKRLFSRYKTALLFRAAFGSSPGLRGIVNEQRTFSKNSFFL